MGQRTRYFRLLVGFVLIAEAIALNVRCDLGLAPLFIVFQGLERHGVATIGTAAVITNVALLVASLAMHERPGLGTLGQVFLVGPLADLALLATPHVQNDGWQVAYLCASLVLMSYGAALYLSANSGAGPYDAVMRGIYRSTRRVPLAGVRVAMETTALAVGWFLGGDVGVGTLVIGLGIGPGIALGLRLLRAMPERHVAEVELTAGAAGSGQPATPATQIRLRQQPLATAGRAVRRRRASTTDR